MLVHYMQRKIWKVGTKKLRETHVSILLISVKQREVLIGDNILRENFVKQVYQQLSNSSVEIHSLT